MEQRTLVAGYKFYCGKDLINAHSAEADTLATFEIMETMLDKYKDVDFIDKSGRVSQPVVNDVKALAEFSQQNRNVDLIGHIVLNENDEEIINFGKHKGRKVEEVFKREPSYYDWMMKGQFPLYTKKVITKIKLRAANTGNMKLF